MVTRIGLFGAAGHMGITLIRAIGVSGSCALAGGCERAELAEARRRPGNVWPDFGRSESRSRPISAACATRQT